MAEKYTPLTAVCKECGKEFVISPEEQERFHNMGYKLPKRCRDCRRVRREARKEDESKDRAQPAVKEQEERLKKQEEDERKLAGLLKTLPFRQTTIDALELKDPSKTLVIIGNGFDLMHGARSSYWDFQKTIGRNSELRMQMEMYLDTDDLWSNLEESLGKLNYSAFLNPNMIDMWLDAYGAYDPDAQAADYFAAIETAIAPTFDIPRELKLRLKRWVKTLEVDGSKRPFGMLHGDYKVLCFNYTEFIETLYGAKEDNVCYIHGCRKQRKNHRPDELILGHMPGMEDEQWDKVGLEPFKYRDPYKRAKMEAALNTAAWEAAWYDESTTKNCYDIIKAHRGFFDGLKDIKEILVIGHSLSRVDHPYFEEAAKSCDARWIIGYHSYDDMKRLAYLADSMGLKDVTVFRT